MSESDTPTRPLISAAISPEIDVSPSDFEKALHEIAHQDQNISITTDPASRQAFIHAMDESLLKRLQERLQRDYAIEARIGPPSVIYLETIRQSSISEGKYIRQTGGHGNYGHVKLTLDPTDPASDLEFVDAVRDGEIPKQFIQAAEQGIRQAAANGIIKGCEIVGLRVTLFDGSYHEQDSNETAFKIAAASAFTDAARKASPVFLEPIMAVELTVPEDHAQLFKADLISRRGRITSLEHRSGAVIRAIAPLATMLEYAQRIQIPNAPLIECTMRFLHYAEIPFGNSPGDDTAGSPAIKPSGPRPRHGSIADNPDSDTEMP